MLVYLGKSHKSSTVHEKVIRDLENSGPNCRQLEDLRQTARKSPRYAGDFDALGAAMWKNTAQERLNSTLVNHDAQRIIEIARRTARLAGR